MHISLSNQTVLIAEADADVASQLEFHLTDLAATVEVELNGSRAIDRALNRDFDLMVLAANLPVASGIQVLSLCRQQGKSCPAIALVEPKLRHDRRVRSQFLDLGFAAIIDYQLETEPLQMALWTAASQPDHVHGTSTRRRRRAGGNPKLAGQ